MSAEEVETSELEEKMRALQEKCRSVDVEVLVDMLAIVVLAHQNLD